MRKLKEIKTKWSSVQLTLSAIADRIECELQTSNIFAWLEQHQTQWQGNSRWWLLAAEDELAMPAQAPRYSSRFELRLGPQLLNKKTESATKA